MIHKILPEHSDLISQLFVLRKYFQSRIQPFKGSLIIAVCGQLISTTHHVIPKLEDHTPGAAERTNEVPATCEKDGSYDETVTCLACGEVISITTFVIPKLNHDWDEGTVTTPPTCSEKGVKTYTCSRDESHTKTEEIDIDADAHVWDAGEVTKAPNCAAEGEKIYRCTLNPDHTKTETIAKDANNHTGGTEVKNAKAATCGADGYTGDKVCAACGKVVEAGSVIPHTGNTDPDTPDDGGNSNADTRVSFLDWLRNLIKKILALFNFGGEGSVC